MVKGQPHLLAISKRSSLSESLTDVLVNRGDTEVISALAENAGARLSEKAYIDLIEKSETDETLLEKLGLRLDIPLYIFRRLLERVSEAVLTRLLTLAPPEKRDDIAEILANISSDVVEADELDRDYAANPTALAAAVAGIGARLPIGVASFTRACRRVSAIRALHRWLDICCGIKSIRSCSPGTGCAAGRRSRMPKLPRSSPTSCVSISMKDRAEFYPDRRGCSCRALSTA